MFNLIKVYIKLFNAMYFQCQWEHIFININRILSISRCGWRVLSFLPLIKPWLLVCTWKMYVFTINYYILVFWFDKKKGRTGRYSIERALRNQKKIIKVKEFQWFDKRRNNGTDIKSPRTMFFQGIHFLFSQVQGPQGHWKNPWLNSIYMYSMILDFNVLYSDCAS